MKRPACTRAPQAEALEDGRLSGAERASFERHAASCAECASELRALVRLRQGAEWLPTSTPTPLERRRQRQALLRRASELRQRAPVQPRRRTFAAFVLSGALMAAVCIGFGLRASLSGSETSAALAAPTYRLHASPGASWQTIEEGAALRLRLGSGSFMLEVDKLTAVQRFVLELPDGELEVVGTHFGVRVEPEGTRRVEVTEGRVALRLRDALPISLGAGENWTAEREAARAAAPPSVPAAEPPSTPAPAAAAPSERSLARARQTALPETKRALEPPSGEQAAPLGTHNDDFARAMAAFGAGDYGQAERLFQDFERRHAEDARQEDSTFLRAVARARRGDAAGARATARQYLERYPNGLRAPEAERLARPREAAESPKREK
jgi:FecR-like protein